MQSGKSTAANFLVEKYKYTRVALADPIKQIINHIDIMKNRQVYDLFIKRYYKLDGDQQKLLFKILDATRGIPKEFPKPRKRLQFLGTDGIRKNIDNQFWLKLFTNKYKNRKKIVVDDCRFLNEYEFFIDEGFKDLKIKVNPDVQNIRLHELYGGSYDTSILQHPSELEQDIIFSRYPKNIIENDGTLDEFYERIKKWKRKRRT